MQNPSLITVEEMMTEIELFQSVYPVFIGEIERVEKARGKLNDFQLMLAVSYAKNGLGVLSFERRQTINAIFTAFTNLYRKEGLRAADRWANEHFGCQSDDLYIEDTQTLEDSVEAGIEESTLNNEDVQEASARIEELSSIIREKETELLEFYRELFMWQTYLGGDQSSDGETNNDRKTVRN
ncbi:hypothetical protein SD71_20205 [Cohnella kolymensis]|uniref:DUF4375 domain-containing protein n=1 Tax=Cohnella kolymensis TaxID=1590652 RepID=A0ABR5A0A6_9BACL|nr:hypothetical protein [Cohnella kolymensis]KIL34357.1 hypothetical protein SD71_20205 [Cohnella kolymensis]